MKYLFVLIFLLFQFLPIEASWKDKTIKDLNTAISWNNTFAIRMIIKHHPEYLNYTDSVKFNTPLVRAIAYRHYAAAKQLLKLGADPNIRTKSRYTPLMVAIQEHPRRDFIYKDTKYIKLLAEYGANLSDICHIPDEGFPRGNDTLTNMLKLTMSAHIEKLKCMVELGADIEWAGPDGETVAVYALLLGRLDKIHYLIVEKKADITKPFYKYKSPVSREIDYSEKHYAIEHLLSLVYPLDSEEYKLKMEIVEEFKRQGVDYQSWKDRIPYKALKRIKGLYGDDWESYVERY